MRRPNATFGYWHEKRRWTAIEDKKIAAKCRPTDRELSKALGRSAKAIQKRRSHLRTSGQ